MPHALGPPPLTRIVSNYPYARFAPHDLDGRYDAALNSRVVNPPGYYGASFLAVRHKAPVATLSDFRTLINPVLRLARSGFAHEPDPVCVPEMRRQGQA
jgi:hypothetical protein